MTSRIELNPLVKMGKQQIETLYGSMTLSARNPYNCRELGYLATPLHCGQLRDR